MKLSIPTYWVLLFFASIISVRAKIVYLNGTEIADENLKIVNVTTQPTQKWFSVSHLRNISNHSATKQKNHLHVFNRKNAEKDEEEAKIEDENVIPSNSTVATRDTTVLSSLRGLWSDLSPILTILSTILGIFLTFVIIESPLSPLPVPPLPYPPVGPYPPTNTYPFGVPPGTDHYGVRYAGPPTYGSYRIPRNRQASNETKNSFDKLFQTIIPSSFQQFFTPNTNSWTEQLAHSIKSYFINFSAMFENKASQLLQETAETSIKGQ